MRLGWMLLAVTSVFGQDWPQFRGVQGNGIVEKADPPVEVGPEKNLKWKTPLPPGHSSPILVGSRIFLTAYEGDKLLTICIDRESGKVQWKREAPRPRTESFQKTNSPASPTPVSDGESVFVFFGDFGMIAYGVDGDERWKLPLGPFNNANGHGSSPMIADEMLVLICDQDTGSYVIALDRKTGKTIWKTDRPETTRGYSTPAVFRPKNAPAQLIVPGAYVLVAYELKTGRKLWWVNGMAWQLKGVPLVDGDTIYLNAWETGGDFDNPPQMQTWDQLKTNHDKNNDGFITRDEAPADLKNWFNNNDLNWDGKIDQRDWDFWILHKTTINSAMAIKPKGEGDLTKQVQWRYRKSLPNVPSPLLYRGALWLVKDGGIVTTLNPRSGDVVKQARIPGAIEQYWSSPVAASGRVYVLSQACKLSVLRGDPEWEVLHVNDLDDECFATPAVAKDGLFVRTRNWLYRFAK